VLLTIEPVCGDVGLDGRRHEKTYRATGGEAGANRSRCDVEGRDALQLQHVPRPMAERLTGRIVTGGILSRNGDLRDVERIIRRRTCYDHHIAERKDTFGFSPGVEIAEGVAAEDEHEPRVGREARAHLAQRVDRVRRAGPLELDARGAEAGHA